MKRTKITAVVLSMMVLFSMVAASKTNKVFADEVEETTEETSAEVSEETSAETTAETAAETDLTVEETVEEVVTDEADELSVRVERIAIDASNFPDFLFREYVKDTFDSDHDGFLSEAEIEAVTSIFLMYRNIESFDGIEFFSNLSYLRIENTQATSLDLSGNPLLLEVNCSNNQLESIDVSNCHELYGLYCYNNNLTSLDLSQNSNLEYFKCFNN